MEEGGQYYISQTCGWQRFEARKVVFSSECLKIFAAGCNIVFGIICHYEHNFDVFREKSTATIICTFGSFCSTKLSFIDHATNFFCSELSVTGNGATSFCLLRKDPGPFHRTQRMRITD